VRARGKASSAIRRPLRKTPATEVEIKLRITDRQALLRRLRRLGATGGTRVREMNTLYDTSDGALAQKRRLLRIRVEWPAPQRGVEKRNTKTRSAVSRPAALLTYKGPPQADGRSGGSNVHRYKIRQEHEVRIENAAAVEQILNGIGLEPWFRYEKYRSAYRLPRFPGLVLDLDETPIGDFLELEGNRSAIDRCAALLGFRPADYISKSYGALFAELSLPPGKRRPRDEPTPAAGLRDMLFRASDSILDKCESSGA
jgi:adenylate cyclase class 2